MAIRKARPKTGEKRKTRQPLKIDQLPETVREAIVSLRNDRFKTWEQIEELSAKSYSHEWNKDGGGFIDWPSIDPELLDDFPGLKLPHSSLQRWYDLRVSQVQTQVIEESKTARAFAAKFSGANIDDPNGAVINAMRDEVFALASKMDSGSRGQYMKALNALTLAMTRIQRVQMQALKVKAEIAKSETERARIAATSGDPREVYLRRGATADCEDRRRVLQARARGE